MCQGISDDLDIFKSNEFKQISAKTLFFFFFHKKFIQEDTDSKLMGFILFNMIRLNIICVLWWVNVYKILFDKLTRKETLLLNLEDMAEERKYLNYNNFVYFL